MAKGGCPWWLAIFSQSAAGWLRREDPAKILSPYLREGMTVGTLDLGSYPVSRLVHEAG